MEIEDIKQVPEKLLEMESVMKQYMEKFDELFAKAGTIQNFEEMQKAQDEKLTEAWQRIENSDKSYNQKFADAVQKIEQESNKRLEDICRSQVESIGVIISKIIDEKEAQRIRKANV